MPGDSFRILDDFLRGAGSFAVDAPLTGKLKWLFIFILIGGGAYGVVMGSLTGLEPGRYHQLIYSGIKVWILFLVTFGLCLPSFFVVNTVAGLRDDFGLALRAVVATQACMAVVLGGLAPLTGLFYLSSTDYDLGVFFNGIAFFVASLSAQIVVRRYYRPLIQKNPLHRRMMRFWFLLYVFVGIQMAWVLRPFIGDPLYDVSFFRPGAWGNAYMEVFKLITYALKSLSLSR